MDFEDHDGFVSIFDGATLNGWTGDTDYWSVKDGAIFSESTCERPTGTIYLYWTGGEVAEFELKLQMKGTDHVNSGVQYRSWLVVDPNAPVFGRAPGAGPGARAAGAGRAAGRGPAGPPPGRAGAPGGRGPQCANPGTPPDRAMESRWDMGGPQFDFDNDARYPGQFYEQSSGRGIIAYPGQVVEADAGKNPRLVATLADQATVASWLRKDDWNQEVIIARGHTYTHILNGHVASVFIDNDPMHFRSTGHIGFEIESTGQLSIKDVWLKKYE
jgi:3-keto-disaccharide hydrolase